MSYDNIIRKANQRLTRLAKLAGRGSTAMDMVTEKLKSIINPQSIYNYYKAKFEKENPPKNAKEIKTLHKRADKFAREKASVPAMEERTFPNGEKITMIIRTAKLKDFFDSYGNAINAQIPTTGEVRKAIAEMGKETTKESVAELFDIQSEFGKIMELYHDMTDRTAYKDIKDIRQKAKDDQRRVTFGEMNEIYRIWGDAEVGTYKTTG